MQSLSRPVQALAILLIAGLVSLQAFAAGLIPLTGRVVDQADLLDPATEAALTQRLAEFEAKSSDQIVVATISSLDGEPIENFANRQFRAWGLGQAGEDNGVLLLVARDDRKMRIEVGYGLEGGLTDLLSKLIIEDTMVPAFRAGDFGGGITGAVEDIITVLEGNAADLEARAKRNQQSQDKGLPWEVIFIISIWVIIFFGSFGIALLAPVFGKKLGPNRYRWLGIDITIGGSSGGSSRGRYSDGRYSGGGGGWSSGSSGGGGFSGGGGSSGGGGASGGW